MTKRNAFYAQSGGVTAVINCSACGFLETAYRYPEQIGVVYAGRNGILGALEENLIDTSQESAEDISGLKYTPGSAFGSCRFKLKRDAEYQRLIEVFQAHNIGYFFYNGGGDSMDTANKVAIYSQKVNYPITCIGIPKTVDNDLPFTDNSPGFGSAAKYIATSIKEATLDILSMHKTSTKIFIMEVMGRHAGWLTAAAGLAKDSASAGPHLMIFPEFSFCQSTFLSRVDQCVKEQGYCVIVVSEGARYKDGTFLSSCSDVKDAFGHTQLGGAAPVLARIINNALGYKYHWAVPDYLQRSGRHLASATDVEQAYAVGAAAVRLAMEDKNAVMPIIQRLPGDVYNWSIGEAPLDQVANVERKMPTNFISSDGMQITQACRDYMAPLIEGESYPPYKNGIPNYSKLKNIVERKKLPEFVVD